MRILIPGVNAKACDFPDTDRRFINKIQPPSVDPVFYTLSCDSGGDVFHVSDISSGDEHMKPERGRSSD